MLRGLIKFHTAVSYCRSPLLVKCPNRSNIRELCIGNYLCKKKRATESTEFEIYDLEDYQNRPLDEDDPKKHTDVNNSYLLQDREILQQQVSKLDYNSSAYPENKKSDNFTPSSSRWQHISEELLSDEESGSDEEIIDEEEIEHKHLEHPNLQHRLLYTPLPKRSNVMSSSMTEVNSDKTGKFIKVEGLNVLKEFIKKDILPVKLFFCKISHVVQLNLPRPVLLLRAPYSDIKFWSTVDKSASVIAIFKKKDCFPKVLPEDTMPLTILCDSVADPRNMGSILRIAAASGCKNIIFTKGCRNAWRQTVLRCAAGAHASLPITEGRRWDEIAEDLGDDVTVIVADVRGIDQDSKHSDAESFNTLPLHNYHSLNYWEKKEVVLILGAENRGISKSAYELCASKNGKRVFIPMVKGFHSLNNASALSVITFEIRRQWDLNSMKDAQEPEVTYREI